MNKKYALIMLSAFALGGSAEDTSLLRTPPMAAAPVIDGKINTEEWKTASRSFGVISTRNNLLCGRKAGFYLGCDANNIYFAAQSDLPPKSIKFEPENAAELILISPDGKKHSLYFAHFGADRLPEGIRTANSVTDKSWELEAAIPLKSLGFAEMPWGKEWKLQMIRHWRSPEETGVWNLKNGQAEFGALFFERNIPATGADDPGYGPSYWFNWYCENTTGAPVTFSCDAERTSIENPISFSRAAKVEPGKKQSFELRGMWATGTIRTMRMCLAADGRELYRRSYSWDYGEASSWIDSNPQLSFDIAVYPSYGKAKARLWCADLQKVKRVKSVVFKVIDSREKTAFQQPAERRKNDFYLKWELPKLPDGDYWLIAEVVDDKGKTETFTKPFAIGSFPWQNNQLGTERVIIPPFKPLSVDKKQRTVTATLTGYGIKNGFWDRIFAQGENILASPVELTVNGGRFECVGTAPVSVEPDRVVWRSELWHGGMKLDVTQDYDYDGFCKVTMNFTPPAGGAMIYSMVMTLPLKAEYAKFMHSTIGMLRRNVSDFVPDGKGVVWDSTRPFYPKGFNRGNFRPYFWFGEFYKGLSWVCESPLNWSMDFKKPSLEVVRDGNSVVLKINIVNKSKIYDRPFELVMGFQPTPVKPQPEDFRKLCGVLYHNNGLRFDNSIALRMANTTWRGAAYSQNCNQLPPNGDWSWSDYIFSVKGRQLEPEFRNEIANKARAFIKKNNWQEMKVGTHSLETNMAIGIIHNRHTDIYEAYFNPRLLSAKNPEFAVFADEWQNSPYRVYRELDEYNTDTDKNYQDFLLWSIRETVRHGWNVVNFDNCYDINVLDDVTGPGEEISPGSIRGYTSIYAMRELVKRTATMLYMENKLLLGRPALTVHMTNSLIVPMHSFAAATITWEMNFGGQDYQDRFPKKFTYAESLGTQTGTIPIVLVQSVNDRPAEVARTMLATTFGYDLLHYRDATMIVPEFFIKAVNIVRNFGYGDPGVKVYPGWSRDNPVKTVGTEALVTSLVKGKQTMLLVGNFGPAGKVTLDMGELGYCKPVINDAETGGAVGSGNRITIDLPRHDYRILLLEDK